MSWMQAWLMQSPTWLWLLAAIAIPVFIHLLRRSNPQEITFAAAHWLQHKRHRRWKKLFLRDRWLLLLRILLLTLLTLLLAQPLLQRESFASDKLALIDPAVSRETLEQLLAQHPQINETYWLEANPSPTDSPRPPAPDVWQTLSHLAFASEFRRAHILLQNSVNPAGHSTLRVSAEWQWHAADTDIRSATAPVPGIAVLGDEPAWLQPVVQQLAETTLPQLKLQRLPATAAPDTDKLDWIIYDTAGPIPKQLSSFVQKGGLLISDSRVIPERATKFVDIGTQSELAAAAMGRGSWLRYGSDWHRETFFKRISLPQDLWQQWSAQDWKWQHQSRSHWSIAAPPGTAVKDSAVSTRRTSTLDDALLFAFALLLLCERSMTLSRRTSLQGGR